MSAKFISIWLAVATLTACSTMRPASENVIVDTRGVDMAAYQVDLAECSAYAEQVRVGRDVAEGTAEGAVVGAAAGAVIQGQEGAEKGAALGGISGGARAARQAEREREQVMRRCLSGRGYRVLN